MCNCLPFYVDIIGILTNVEIERELKKARKKTKKNVISIEADR